MGYVVMIKRIYIRDFVIGILPQRSQVLHKVHYDYRPWREGTKLCVLVMRIACKLFNFEIALCSLCFHLVPLVVKLPGKAQI